MLPSGIFNTKYQTDIAIVRTKTQWFLLIAGLVILFVVPPLLFTPVWLSWIVRSLSVTIIAVLGLHILTGLCGQISLGHAAFVMVGAYATGIITSQLNWSPWATLPLAGVVAGLVGVIFGAPSLRIKGFYLAMSTLAAQFIIIWLVKYFSGVTGGVIGINVTRIGSGVERYYLAAGLVVALTFFAKNMQRTNLGRSLIAIRDNDLAAQVMGINLFRYKLIAFFIGCFYAGIAGWLWAHSLGNITPEDFPLMRSIWYLGMLVVGGVGSTTGAVLGAGSMELLDKLTLDYLSPWLAAAFPAIGAQIASVSGYIVFALVVILFLILEPRGLYHRWEVFKSSYRLHPYSY